MSRITKDIEGFFPPTNHVRRVRVTKRWVDFAGWLPLIVFPGVVLMYRNGLTPWIFMWVLAVALYWGCKWLTWWRGRRIEAPKWRHLAYLLIWPGMDAEAFLDTNRRVIKPQALERRTAVLKTLIGGLLVWRIVRFVPATQPLLRGWIGLIGLVLLLHFGTFQLVSLLWRCLGVDAQPLMQEPVKSKTLAEFWGKRWNSAFNLLVHGLIFRRLFRHVGIVGATLAVFLVSGLIHDLVISIPAHGGYGLPTTYFLLQGLGLCLERIKVFKGFRGGVAGRCFTVAVTAIPAFWLFHPPFIKNIILPMLHAIGAT